MQNHRWKCLDAKPIDCVIVRVDNTRKNVCYYSYFFQCRAEFLPLSCSTLFSEKKSSIGISFYQRNRNKMWTMNCNFMVFYLPVDAHFKLCCMISKLVQLLHGQSATSSINIGIPLKLHKFMAYGECMLKTKTMTSKNANDLAFLLMRTTCVLKQHVLTGNDINASRARNDVRHKRSDITNFDAKLTGLFNFYASYDCDPKWLHQRRGTYLLLTAILIME